MASLFAAGTASGWHAVGSRLGEFAGDRMPQPAALTQGWSRASSRSTPSNRAAIMARKCGHDW